MAVAPQKDGSGSGLSKAQFWHYFRRYPYILAKLCLFGLAILVAYSLLKSVQSVLFPVFVSLLIAYLLSPAVDYFERRKVNRTATIVMFMGVGLLGLALFTVFLYPTIAKQVALVWERLPLLTGVIETRLFPWLEQQGVEIPSTVSGALSEYGNSIRDSLPSIVERVSKWVTGLAAQTGLIIANLLYIVMIPLFVFYFLRDFNGMKPVLVDLVPLHHRDFVLERVHRADEVVGAWFRGQVEVSLILAGLYAVGLGVVFGFSGVGMVSGITIGALTGVLNVIPYFGVFIGLVLSYLIVILDWHGIGPLIGVGVVFGVVQLLEG